VISLFRDSQTLKRFQGISLGNLPTRYSLQIYILPCGLAVVSIAGNADSTDNRVKESELLGVQPKGC